MKKIFLSLCAFLLTLPAHAQVQLGGHIVVPSTSDSSLGASNVVMTDANCNIVTASGCTVSSGPYVKTLNVTGSLTAARALTVVASPGREYAVTNSTGQLLTVGGTSGATVQVPNGSTVTINSPDGTSYYLAGGASAGPSGNGQVQSSSADGKSFTAATPAQITQPVIAAVKTASASQHASFGDSIVYGAGPNNPAGFPDANLGFAHLSQQYIGGPYSSYGIGGDATYDTALTLNSVATPSLGSVYVIDTSMTNDTAEFGNNANYLKMAQRALTDHLYRLLIPATAKNFLQSSTFAGGFAVDSGPTYQPNQGAVSNTNGATLTQAITIGPSGVLAGCYMVINGDTATFTLSVGGVSQTDPIGGSTTWQTYGDGGQVISTSHGATQFCAGFRLTGLTPGSATVQFTQTASGTLNVQWLASPPAKAANNPWVFSMDVPQLGPGNGTSNYMYTNLYQAIFTTVSGYASTDGLNITPIGARAALGANPGTQGYFAPDNTHPSALGASIIAGLVFTAADSAGVVTAPSVYGSIGAEIAVPDTDDVTKGASFNPTSALDGNGTSWSGLIRYTHNSQGQATWEGDGYAAGNASGHLFMQTANSYGYSFCYANRNSNPENFHYPPNSTAACDLVVRGGQLQMGVQSGLAAMLVSPNSIAESYSGTVGYHYFGANNNVVSPPIGLPRSPGVNTNSPIFAIRSQTGSDSSAACVGAAWQMVVPSSGVNQPGVLTLTNDTGCHGVGSFVLPYTVDWTSGPTAVAFPHISAPDVSLTPNTLATGSTCGTHLANALWADDNYIYHCNNAGTAASRAALNSF